MSRLTYLHILGLAASASIAGCTAGAQGVTGSGIHGNVSAPDRSAAIRVSIRHDSTGYSVDVPVNRGRFFIQNLEPGGPYTITARAVGFTPARQRNLVLSLGELRTVELVLNPLADILDTVIIAASDDVLHRGVHADGGTGMSITTTQLEKLPTLNRDLYDFVRLIPQISTRISLANAGLSAAGTGFRFNNFLINGVSDRTLSGSVSNAFSGNKSISLDAVKEYQVLVSPYDVRYGDFAGAFVNAVTKAGTNVFRGSLFVFGRTDELGRDNASPSLAQYERIQYGFSLGGPIVRDRVHFFIAPELQHFTFPAPGPYLGQPLDAPRPFPVTLSDLERFESIMRSFELTAGSAGAVENENSLRNLFARVDVAFPAVNSRAVISYNYGGADDVAFSRDARDEFSLTSNLVTRTSRFRTTSARVHTALGRAGGGDNEFLISYRRDGLAATPAVFQPTVRVGVTSVSGSAVTLTSGSPEASQGNPVRASSLAARNTLTLPVGANHVITTGAEVEKFEIRRGNIPVSYGAWSFASLTDFALGIADRYEVRIGFEPSDLPLRGSQYAAYVSDRWQIVDRLTLTAGLRADLLDIDGHAPNNAVIDSLFARRTDQMPRVRAEFSPRAGFTWEPSRSSRDLLRGGIGIFATRYPPAWAQTAQTAYGAGGLLICSRAPGSRGPPPEFSADYRNPPTACAGGGTITREFQGDVNLLDPNLRMMRVLRSSIAYDRQLSRSVVFTNEALFSRALSDFVAVNLNLGDPVGTDANGRVMYGALNSAGQSLPSTRSGFTEVIDLRNTSRNHSWSFATRLEKKQTAGLTGFVSYTLSRARDVQTLTRVNNRGTVLWSSARTTSGRHDRLAADISSNDIPHRAVAAGTYAFPWRYGKSELSFYYVGESGRPFTYIAFGTSRRGDLNADGSNANDPIYVPFNAGDASEIRINNTSESTAFESLIERTTCLRSQRGTIMARNSCREPWSNVTIASLRHAIPVARRSLEIQLDVFNVLNLLRSDWGHRREAAPLLLQHDGQVTTESQKSMSVFRFNTSNPDWTTSPVESSYQLQLAVRYRI